MTVEVKIHDLVNDGLLDLDGVFEDAEWKKMNSIATYTSYCYGDGTVPGEVEVVLEYSQRYGITAYRWAERNGSRRLRCGVITLDCYQAEVRGKDFAEYNANHLR